jgi:predicted nucleotidyltransferase
MAHLPTILKNQKHWDSIVLAIRSGSHAYGLNTDTSDVDINYIYLPSEEERNNIFNEEKQRTNDEVVVSTYDNLRNPLNPKLEITGYTLKRYFELASGCNPNIMEIMFGDEKNILKIDKIGEQLRRNRDIFLSKKAYHTLTGYAFAQMAKIERHYKWLSKGELVEPKREDFGLPSVSVNMDEVFKVVQRIQDEWVLNSANVEREIRDSILETVWEHIYYTTQVQINWGNWPIEYEKAIMAKIKNDLDLGDDVYMKLGKEAEYRRAVKQYKSWLDWKANRNVERARLEKEHKHDTKHSSHLIRLLIVAHQLLTTGKWNVLLDADSRTLLRDIKNGAYDYDAIKKMSEEWRAKTEEAYKTSTLPMKVDREQINKLYWELVSKNNPMQLFWNPKQIKDLVVEALKERDADKSRHLFGPA